MKLEAKEKECEDLKTKLKEKEKECHGQSMKLKEKDDERAIETDRSRTKRMGSE